MRPPPITGAGTWVTSNTGGIEPVWSHSGRELFAPRNGQRQMVAVTIETRPTFSTGASAVLFSETGLLSSVLHPQCDASPDDQRVVTVRQPIGDAAGALILVLNVFEELTRQAP